MLCIISEATWLCTYLDHSVTVVLAAHSTGKLTISPFVTGKCLGEILWDCANILFLHKFAPTNFSVCQSSCCNNYYCSISLMVNLYYSHSFYTAGKCSPCSAKGINWHSPAGKTCPFTSIYLFIQLGTYISRNL